MIETFYVMSAEQVATATCPHSLAVGICKNGFSEPILQNAGITLYLFLIKRINRFIMLLVSGMAAKPPRNNL